LFSSLSFFSGFFSAVAIAYFSFALLTFALLTFALLTFALLTYLMTEFYGSAGVVLPQE
jgi:hypothetical protein